MRRMRDHLILLLPLSMGTTTSELLGGHFTLDTRFFKCHLIN